MLTARGEQRGVELVDVLGTDRPQRERPEGRDDVSIDHPPVAVAGRGTDSALPLRQPLLEQEAPKRRLATSRARRHVPGRNKSQCDRLGIGPRRSGGMRAAPFSARDRVSAVVVDDVEAITASDDVGHARCIDHFDANPKIMVTCASGVGGLACRPGGYVGAALVCDLRHFLDMADDVPGPAKRLAVQLGAIVRASGAAGREQRNNLLSAARGARVDDHAMGS